MAVIRRRVLASIMLALVWLGLIASPALAAFTPPYHIHNFSGSKGTARIYANSGCSGSTHDLAPGRNAQSVGWDGIRAWRPFQVEVYDDKTGDFIVTRKYSAGACAGAASNFYYVTVS